MQFSYVWKVAVENVYVCIKDTFKVHMELETLPFCLYSDSWLINLVILILPVQYIDKRLHINATQ